MRSANQRDRPIRGSPVSGPPEASSNRVAEAPGKGSLRSGRFQVGPGAGGKQTWPVREDCGALCAQALEFRSWLLGAARSSRTARTDLCLEPIPARGACCESPASPPALSCSHFPERKSVCGSGRGGICSEEWRRRVRRCAWLDDRAPRPAPLSEWAVARGRLVLTTREPARRDPLALRARGMGSGSPGIESLREGWRTSGTVGDRRKVGVGTLTSYGSPRGPAGGRRPWLTLGLASLIHLIRLGSRARRLK